MKKITAKSKILCVCEGGNVRSVALAFLFKLNGVDTLSCGVTGNTLKTSTMLYRWADNILIAEAWMLDRIPAQFRKKVTDMEIGPDRWGLTHKELLDLCRERMTSKLGLK